MTAQLSCFETNKISINISINEYIPHNADMNDQKFGAKPKKKKYHGL